MSQFAITLEDFMLFRTCFVLITLLRILSGPASAQLASPSPSPHPTVAAAPTWHNPPNSTFSIFDPCGGRKELLLKFGPTPCVYVLGEGMVSAGYTNISAHGALTLPHGAQEVSLPLSGNANVYPSLLMAFGVSPSSQLQITAPSQVVVNTGRFGSFSAASNISFNYKQRLFFSPTTYTQGSIDLGYTAPTNGGGVTSSGPAYQIQLLFAQPLNANVSIGPWWTFKNAQAAGLTQTKERAWSDPLGAYIIWSPLHSSFDIIPVVYHDFNPNRTAIAVQVVQLLTRHLSFAVTYGGVETTSQSNGPSAQVFTFAANSSPRVFSANLYYLINESNLPPRSAAAAPSATATPTATP